MSQGGSAGGRRFRVACAVLLTFGGLQRANIAALLTNHPAVCAPPSRTQSLPLPARQSADRLGFALATGDAHRQ